MTRFIKSLDRSHTSLFPECIDDYVDADNPVRTIDAFIDMLDLASLRFDVAPEATSHPTNRSSITSECSRSSPNLHSDFRNNLRAVHATPASSTSPI